MSPPHICLVWALESLAWSSAHMSQGYAELFTRPGPGARIGVLYLDDFHGQLVEAPAAYRRHAPQPTEWRLVPVQGYHFGR